MGYQPRYARWKAGGQALDIDKTRYDPWHGDAGDETIEFMNPVLQDNKLAWSLRITKPMRLNLKFEVVVDGDHMVGIAKAGLLPASKHRKSGYLIVRKKIRGIHALWLPGMYVDRVFRIQK